MAGNEYRSKPKLTTSLVNGTEPLSEAAVQKILSSKVSLPKSINLAIVRLSDSNDGLEFQTIDKEISDNFYNKSAWGGRVQSIIPVPQVMVARPVTLTSLRQAAVLLQADALLIIKPTSYSDWRFEFFNKDTAKSVTSLEVLLLDTRTSVVPFTSLVSETTELKAEGSDYSKQELMARAQKASESKALMNIPQEVQKFISKAM